MSDKKESKKLLKVYGEGIEIIDDDLYKKIEGCNLSASMANSFLACPADWLLDKYMMPLIEHEEPIYLTRGTAFHKVMEHFFTMKPNDRNPRNLAKLTMLTLEKEYPDLNTDAESVAWMKDAVRDYLKMGFDYQNETIPQVKIGNNKPQIGLEFFVKNKFGTKRPIVGFIDKLAILNNDSTPRMVMQDWKTGKQVHNYDPSKPISIDNSFDYPRQQTLYAMMMEKNGIELSDASLIFPVANEIVDVDFKDERIREQAVSDMQKLDKRLDECIRKNYFPFTPAMWCTWCHLLYQGRTVGRNNPPKININEFNQLVEYAD